MLRGSGSGCAGFWFRLRASGVGCGLEVWIVDYGKTYDEGFELPLCIAQVGVLVT